MKKQTGYTLIEIMIALLLGLIIISATIAIYVNTIKGSTDTINSARLNHDLESVMSLMVNDIRRAGYWGGAIVGADSSTNPFTTGTADIQIPSASCILYSYDADGDGLVETGEYYGFNLDGSTIDMRLTGATTANCANGSWNALTVSEIVNITALSFTLTYKCLNVTTTVSYNMLCAAVTAANLATGAKAVESRQIDITLTGRLVNDPTVTKTLTGSAKVRSDRIFTQP
jgi:type IV pilus assembly protein PilW